MIDGKRSTRVRVIEVLKSEGAAGVVSRALALLINLRMQLLLECDLTIYRPAFVLPDVRFEWASLQDLERYPVLGLAATAEMRAMSEARLCRGDRCLVGHWSGQPATYLWVTTTYRELPRLALPIRPNAAYVYKTFTVADWRGRGLNRAALTFALDDCRAGGARTAFVDVDVTNRSSLLALRGAGFLDVAHYRTLKIGPATITLISDAAYSRVSGCSRRHRMRESIAEIEPPVDGDAKK